MHIQLEDNGSMGTGLHGRNKLIGTVRIFSDRCVEGTRYPPMLDTRFTRWE